jgi:hypothetical protein
MRNLGIHHVELVGLMVKFKIGHATLMSIRILRRHTRYLSSTYPTCVYAYCVDTPYIHSDMPMACCALLLLLTKIVGVN